MKVSYQSPFELQPNWPLATSLGQHLAAAWPASDWQAERVVVAVSGGADSVALLRGLQGLAPAGKNCLLVAHFDHQARGAESTADAEFARDLAGRLGLECRLGRPEGALVAGDDGWEAAARAARYAFLTSTAEWWGARFVATAHTADDQAETILHQVLRGSGLAGLAGMPRARMLSPAVTLIRPLLELSCRDVEAFLREIGQPWREDATNLDGRFTRNRIRHELLPLLERDYYPGAREALRRLGRAAGEAQAALEQVAQAVLTAALREARHDGVTLELRALAGQPRHVVRELFVQCWRERGWPRQDMAQRHWDALAGLALDESPAPALTLPGNVAACRVANLLTLTRRAGDSVP